MLQSGQHTSRRRPERYRLALEIDRPQIAAQLQSGRSTRSARRRIVHAIGLLAQFGARIKVPLQRVDLAKQNVFECLDLVDLLAQTAIGALQAAAAGRRRGYRLQGHGAVVPAQRCIAMDVIVVDTVGNVGGLFWGRRDKQQMITAVPVTLDWFVVITLYDCSTSIQFSLSSGVSARKYHTQLFTDTSMRQSSNS